MKAIERMTGMGDPLLKMVRALGRSAPARRDAGFFVAEGEKLFEEAVRWGVPIQAVLTCGENSARSMPAGVRHVAVSASLMNAISALPSPPGLLLVCKTPAVVPPARLPAGRYLILDRLQDPGNLGTILRAAAAFGASAVLLCDGCADPYGPKAVRAAMGAVFHVQIYRGSAETLREAVGDLPLYTTVLDGNAVQFPEIPLNPSVAVIGQEGVGVSDFWRREGAPVRIPMEEGTESINAAMAAALVLWEGTQQSSARGMGPQFGGGPFAGEWE